MGNQVQNLGQDPKKTWKQLQQTAKSSDRTDLNFSSPPEPKHFQSPYQVLYEASKKGTAICASKDSRSWELVIATTICYSATAAG